MSGLPLAIAVGDYDRTRPLIDGVIPIDGVEPTFLKLEPEEIFFRALRHQEFDICELSMSSYSASLSRGTAKYIALPVFPSRAFRHTAFYVRADSPLKTLEDLRGKRIGLPEYQLTACVWARIIMSEGGIEAAECEWVRGGLEQAGRIEKIALNLPPEIKLSDAPIDKTLPEMLLDGEIDAIVSPRPPRQFEERDSKLRWLFPDPVAEATAYYQRTKIFPIMHVLALKREVYEKNRWLPSSLLKAFTLAKNAAVARLEENSATKVTLPFVEDRVTEAKRAFGEDYWSYGFKPNEALIRTFLEHHHRQGLSERLLEPRELFAEEALELYAI